MFDAPCIMNMFHAIVRHGENVLVKLCWNTALYSIVTTNKCTMNKLDSKSLIKFKLIYFCISLINQLTCALTFALSLIKALTSSTFPLSQAQCIKVIPCNNVLHIIQFCLLPCIWLDEKLLSNLYNKPSIRNAFFSCMTQHSPFISNGYLTRQSKFVKHVPPLWAYFIKATK